ncbi:DUF3429 domain-containing protein [Paucibacter sp. B2R-40]|uniref:DUF3429 domain-containing protein n=1 Tax=Paucibacter sp. B2R-40 TaxID=2893554 RepID=UPI0021E41040|nr:DUF3429 domain-containing protein [Paucibacter sp. B2R-40]MCV2354553.1 DUF3429 domain-containing protein [Paucibacter sp. B2R-40]
MPVAATAHQPLPLNPLALRLGHLGLLPFVIGAALVWLVGGRDAEAHAWISFALSAYAALIISFLGGIYWGLGFRQVEASAQPFVWGVLPSLGAWVALVMPAYAGLVLHGVMLIVCYLVDRRLYPALGAAAWLTLRFRLSAVAALCCFLAAAGS